MRSRAEESPPLRPGIAVLDAPTIWLALLAAQFGLPVFRLVLAAVLPWTKQLSSYNCFLVQVPQSKRKVGHKKCITEELFLHPQMSRLKHIIVISLVESIFNDHEQIGITRNEPNTR